MSWSESSNSDVNASIRRAVDTEVHYGQNWMGATAALADWLDVSPQIVRMRYRGEVTGAPRAKRNIVARCWAFLDRVAERERAWIETLSKDVERRADMLQLTLPLEQDHGSRGNPTSARRVARDEADVAKAHRALDTYRNIRSRT